MSSSVLSALFVALLAASVATRLWLSARQIRHVRTHRAAVPPDFSVAISLATHQKAADYTIAKTRAGTADLAVGLAALLLLTFGGGIDAISMAWQPLFVNGGVAHGTALILSTAVLLGAIDLPLAVYRTFVIEARFGFNRMTPALFLSDLARQAALSALFGIPLVTLVLWLMAVMGDAWWLWAWGTWMGFNLLMLLLYPTLIAPLFNRFTPLTDATLAQRIETLLERCGFSSRGLYVMDGSRRSSHGNAYFTGFGRAKRIVFFDTLLSRLDPGEVEAVLAHELGHFRYHHVWKRIAVLALGSLVFLWCLGQLMEQSWFYAGFGVHTQTTAAALLLFVLVAPVFTFFLIPLVSWLSRAHEFEADAYAVQHATARDLVNALVKLYQDNAATLTPDPVHSAFYDSHPPASIRIARLGAAAG